MSSQATYRIPGRGTNNKDQEDIQVCKDQKDIQVHEDQEDIQVHKYRPDFKDRNMFGTITRAWIQSHGRLWTTIAYHFGVIV